MGSRKSIKEKRVQLHGVDGKKRNFKFPPNTPQSEVSEFKTRARRMVKSHKAGFPPSDSDMRFLETAGETIRKKFQLLGLLADQETSDEKFRLGPFLSRVCELDGEETARKKVNVAMKLQAYFGPNKDLRSITVLEGQEFRKALVTRWSLCETSTVPRHIGYAANMLQVAVDDGLISRNPFAKQPKSVRTDRAKWHHISHEETKAIWEALQTEQDRLRFLFLRYLGLRAPSEMNALTWDCLDWDSGTVLIKSQKTAHHKDGGYRRCPFSHPDILPLLKGAHEARAGDKEPVLPRISHAALTRKVQRWLGRAGIPLWPQLLVNFRRSAATDAHDYLPAHVAAAYFGHSNEIFKSHYGIQKTEHVKAFGEMPSLLS